MREYIKPILTSASQIETVDAPQQDEKEIISACLTRWPGMAQYADTARVEQWYDAQRCEWRYGVTVTCFDKALEQH